MLPKPKEKTGAPLPPELKEGTDPTPLPNTGPGAEEPKEGTAPTPLPNTGPGAVALFPDPNENTGAPLPEPNTGPGFVKEGSTPTPLPNTGPGAADPPPPLLPKVPLVPKGGDGEEKPGGGLKRGGEKDIWKDAGCKC